MHRITEPKLLPRTLALLSHLMERDVEADDESTPWLFVFICVSMLRLTNHCNPSEDSKVIRKWGSTLHLGHLNRRINQRATRTTQINVVSNGTKGCRQQGLPPWPREDRRVGRHGATVVRWWFGAIKKLCCLLHVRGRWRHKTCSKAWTPVCTCKSLFGTHSPCGDINVLDLPAQDGSDKKSVCIQEPPEDLKSELNDNKNTDARVNNLVCVQHTWHRTTRSIGATSGVPCTPERLSRRSKRYPCTCRVNTFLGPVAHAPSRQGGMDVTLAKPTTTHHRQTLVLLVKRASLSVDDR